MMTGCRRCHSSEYVDGFYRQYDDFVILYNEKFAIPGRMIMDALYEHRLVTDKPFDDEIEWTWYFLWHHEGRRARHGAAMMAPKFAHERGLAQVANRFYRELVPQARAITKRAVELGKIRQAATVNSVIDSILARPEHAWQER